MMTEEKLVKEYQKAQKKLVQIILKKQAHGSAASYERSLLRQIQKELKKLKKSSKALVEQLVKENYKTGLQSLIDDLIKDDTAPRLFNMFSGLNTSQIELITQNANIDLNKSINIVGRRMQDAVREAGIEATAEKLTTGQTIREMQKNLQDKLKQQNLTAVEYANGTKMPIEKYAETVARSTTAETQNKAKVIQGQDWGYDLVRFTEHSPTCEVCSMYQGRVYALTKEAANGKYKGSKGQELHFPYLYDTALISGYNTIHPNCRHRLSVLPAGAYTAAEMEEFSRKSMQPFEDMRSDKERKEYAKEQKIKRKRNAARRQYEEIKATLPNEAPKTFAGFIKMKTAKSERYKELLEDYRTVTSIAKQQKSGIIELERMRSSSDYAVPKDLVSSREFRSKFDSMDTDKHIQREYYQAVKEMLTHRSGNNGEDLLYYNTVTNKWYKSTTGTAAGTPDYKKEILQALRESNPNEIVSFHNHPLGMPPSDGDLNAALANGYKKGYTIGHNGVIFEYTPPKYKIPESAYMINVERFKKQGMNEFEAQLATLNELKKLYGFSFREVE